MNSWYLISKWDLFTQICLILICCLSASSSALFHSFHAAERFSIINPGSTVNLSILSAWFVFTPIMNFKLSPQKQRTSLLFGGITNNWIDGKSLKVTKSVLQEPVMNPNRLRRAQSYFSCFLFYSLSSLVSSLSFLFNQFYLLISLCSLFTCNIEKSAWCL